MNHTPNSKFIEHAEKVLASIDQYSRLGGAEVTREQLETAKGLIQKMIQIVINNQLPPKANRSKLLTRIIVDEWPLGHSLGSSISKLEEEYTRLV